MAKSVISDLARMTSFSMIELMLLAMKLFKEAIS